MTWPGETPWPLGRTPRVWKWEEACIRRALPCPSWQSRTRIAHGWQRLWSEGPCGHETVFTGQIRESNRRALAVHRGAPCATPCLSVPSSRESGGKRGPWRRRPGLSNSWADLAIRRLSGPEVSSPRRSLALCKWRPLRSRSRVRMRRVAPWPMPPPSGRTDPVGAPRTVGEGYARGPSPLEARHGCEAPCRASSKRSSGRSSLLWSGPWKAQVVTSGSPPTAREWSTRQGPS